jgi:hypothetical protein
MARRLVVRTLCGVLAVAVLIGASLLSTNSALNFGEAAQKQGKRKAAQKRPAPAPAPHGPITMVPNQVTLEVSLGLKDKEQTMWRGEVQVTDGKVTGIEIAQGGVKSTVNGSRFSVLHRKQQTDLLPPLLRVNLEAPPAAGVTIKAGQGEFSFKLADLPDGPASFLDGQASVEKLASAIRLTGPATEDDFPAMATARDGTIWMAYVEYQPGPPLVQERILNREFDSLAPSGHGDRIRLVRFDGKVWHEPQDVTEGELDVWRPTVAVNGKGEVCVAWSQKVGDDWEIFYRCYAPGGEKAEGTRWSPIVRLTRHPGSDFHVASATDSSGVVWLAWQGWRENSFKILAAALADNHPWTKPRVVSSSQANNWSPALAADRHGNVYVAWDTYDKGNYDVRLRTLSDDGKEWAVADSPKFEARPALAADAEGRIWIAYEEGDEQWGKDYSTDQFRRIGFKKNPGNGLYNNRTVRVKCLVDGKLMRPAGSLEEAFGASGGARLTRNKSVPRLAVDKSGGIWLLFRHHPLPLGNGETWHSFAVRYDGKSWSMPRRLAQSANLLDNRPALVPFEDGILAVYSTDYRVRTQNRGQDDLYAAVLRAPAAATNMELTPDTPAGVSAQPARVAVVHPEEVANVEFVRSFRVQVGGKKLKLVRGEFHRHTEYSAHRDQDGMLEDSWRYALDAGRLDWMGNGDHDNGFGNEYMWWQVQKICDLYQNPPQFVAAMTYERSNQYPNGHRNVMMPRRGVRPLPRGDLKGTPEAGTPDTKLLYAYLKHFGGICASHTSATGMGTDWRDNDPQVEPVVEIYQGHRHNYEHFGAPRSPTADTQIGGYEPKGFVWNALEKGYRLGFQSSSDHISTHMSYGVALVEENSRQSIIDAFKERHSYGATDNIVLIVRSGDHLMGDSFETARRPTLEIVAHGTTVITKVHVIRDNQYVYSYDGSGRSVKLQYTDMAAKPGQTSYYYVRLEQADGNLAWASPMWITYKP